MGSIEQHSQILLVADGIPSGTKHLHGKMKIEKAYQKWVERPMGTGLGR